MDFLSRAQSPPNSASTTGTKRSRMFLPLSNHGMPRTPLPTSPGGSVRSHRFDKSQRSPNGPRSPGSPPMSARTFMTFFSSNDSEPAYSPRSPMAPSHLSGSTLAGSPQPTPSLPPIPQFEKVQFEKVPLFDNVETVHAKRRSRTTPVSPVAEHGIHNVEELIPPVVQDKVKEEELEERPIAVEPAVEPAANPAATRDDQGQPSGALSRLSRRIRTVLGSKSEKKDETRRRSKEAAKDLDRMEDVHWTEM